MGRFDTYSAPLGTLSGVMSKTQSTPDINVYSEYKADVLKYRLLTLNRQRRCCYATISACPT